MIQNETTQDSYNALESVADYLGSPACLVGLAHWQYKMSLDCPLDAEMQRECKQRVRRLLNLAESFCNGQTKGSYNQALFAWCCEP